MLDEAQRSLVAEHVGEVAATARSLARRLPPNVDFGDLVGPGHFGLIDSATRWDPAAGVPFSAFARPRIRGAMIDDLRLAARVVRDPIPDDAVRRGRPCDVDRREFWRSVRSVVGTRSSIVLRAYFRGDGQSRIGARLGVTQSRVAQVAGRSIERLRGDAWFRREYGPVSSS